MAIRRSKFRLPPPFDAQGMTASLRSTLTLYIWAMALGSAFTVITAGAPFTGLAKAVGVSDLGYSLLTALPFVGGAVQLYAASVLERRRNRRTMFLTYGIAARIVWLAVGLVPLWAPGTPDFRMAALLLLCSMSALCGAFLNVSFTSVLADIVPMHIRGRYLAVRSRAGILAVLITAFVSAWLLDALPPRAGYIAVFALAALAGTGDVILYFWTEWPPMEGQTDRPEGFLVIMRRAMRDARFMRVCAFWTLWYFTIRITNPFWNIFMLGHLEMTFKQISVMVTVVYNLAALFMVTRWGRMIDRFGNYPVAALSCLIILVIPIPYLFASPGSVWMIPIAELISGIAWSGCELAALNMYLGCSPQHGRSVYIAIYMLMTQLVGHALAFIAGGALAEHVTPVFDALIVPGLTLTRHTGVFIISMGLRLIVFALLLPRLRGADAPKVRQVLGTLWREGADRALRARRSLGGRKTP